MKQSVSLPDLCDAYPNEVRVADPLLQNYGGQVAFSGPIKTIACFEDNALVAERVQEPGGGGVLVVDAGGSLRCGMLGDNLAKRLSTTIGQASSSMDVFAMLRSSDGCRLGWLPWQLIP
jgi:regulator of ribonuclease activity A